MNNELSQLLITMFKDGKDFVIGQGPDIIQQYLAGEIFRLTVDFWTWTILSAILFLIMVFLTIVAFCEEELSLLFVNVVLGVILFLFLCAAIDNGVAKYKLTHYPKGYLLEQVLRPEYKK